MAVYSAMHHFHYILEDRQFQIFRKHKPLAGAIQSRQPDSGTRSAWELRQMSFIYELTTDIRHIKGTDNIAAETLPRAIITQISSNPNLTRATLLTHQQNDAKLTRHRATKRCIRSLRLHITWIFPPLWCGICQLVPLNP